MVLGVGMCVCLRCVVGKLVALFSEALKHTRSSTLLSKGLVEKIEASLRVPSKKGPCWGRKA